MPPEIDRHFVGLPSPTVGRSDTGGHPCQGIWHAPRGEQPTVGFIATHQTLDFSEHFLGDHLASRGFGFLGWNTRFRNAPHTFLLDHAVAEVEVGVRWMREVAGIETVVLLGSSGGSALMAAYQSHATEANLRPSRGLPPLDALKDLTGGDLIVLVGADAGPPLAMTKRLDGAMTDEADPTAIDQRLDIYNPENGPPFSAEFLADVRTSQFERSKRITDWCNTELPALVDLGLWDRLFAVNRVWADPRFVDATLDANRRPATHCELGDPAQANAGMHGAGLVTSVRSWLSMYSLSDSQCHTAPHLRRIQAPTLFIEADADSSVFPSESNALFEAIAAEDTTRMRRTANHDFVHPQGARDRLTDAISKWVSARVS